MNRAHGLMALLVAALALGCPKKAPPATNAAKVAWKMSKSGDGFRLSDADAAAAPEAVPLAKATLLSAAETDNVLARMPPLKAALSDDQGLALRDKSRPAPRPGKTVTDAFPGPGGPPPAPPGPG